MTSQSTQLLVTVTRRLFFSLLMLLALVLATIAFMPRSPYVVPVVVLATGFIGGFVGVQRQLKELTVQDLELMADSWIYTCLSPFVGGVLALLLYVLMLSELVSGNLFPAFEPDDPAKAVVGFGCILDQHAVSYQAYAKLVFWCFVAGFSERFVTNILSRFEGASIRTLGASGEDDDRSKP